MTTVLIMAGGTGGHVFPALAVAEALRARGAEVRWLGTRRGLEAELVPKAGFPLDWISIGGLRGKGLAAWAAAPVKLAVAVAQVTRVIFQRRPAVVLGMGGFVTGPGGLAAKLWCKPLLIHEQNAVAGLTNRLLAPLARRVFEAFPGTFPHRRHAVVTGNPVRTAIASLPPPAQRFADRAGAVRVLVLGGSQGAGALNALVPQALAGLSRRPEVWHQSGKRHLEDTRAAYEAAGVAARIEPFIEDMAAAYGWADLVICRAGALTVSELAAAGLGAVLVPYPFAVDDHQSRNADHLAAAGAAVVVPQADLSAVGLREILSGWGADRSRLLAMAGAARRLARVDAAEQVAKQCLEVARGA
ncbi:MAG TPA: undecaprenyldiphospho-muramoylpentapeptide beta-N-acetylglucosaminyltransferase [Gammaproteobacteria bacterium]|nr:undecaprenyldiphospho-muramoylpentapeptide beta-N-acetylglucosaminyltransferase [Gammaproteobacteria bacterium]